MTQSGGKLLPIDIHYNKLIDWLVSRRHIDQQWQSAAFTIREKINAAIQDMPAVEEITKLLAGTYINYFHCLRIVELLKDTESATKNIFGRYSSQRMKDWQEIVKLYEKDDVYLAEVSQLLTRNVNYEIPSLKRQIVKCQQMQAECTRKEGEHKSNAAELREKFNSSCKQMNIEGKKIKKELFELVKDLPTVFGKVAKSTQQLKKAVDFYADFLSFTLSREDEGNTCCQMLRYIQKNGNSTVYEWRVGEKPLKVEEPILNVGSDSGDEEATGDEIDWGADNIDYDISVDSGAEAIDFGDDAAIDWGGDNVTIEVVNADTANITEEGVARGNDALTLLENTKTRNMFTDELLELEAFLGQRLQEMSSESDVMTTSQFQSAPSSLHVDLAAVQDMQTAIQDILSHLTTVRMQHLFLIRSSPRYVDRLAESLKANLSAADKMVALQRLMVTKREEALEEQRQIEPKLDLIRKRTKELQKQVEEEISKKYQNRPVNIMGEINTV